MLGDGSQVSDHGVLGKIFYTYSYPLIGKIWSTYSVLNVLYSLIQKSKINENLIATRDGASPEEIA